MGAARVILHVDMDAFYAAVEVLQDPSLAGRPVVVGGTGRRGVVASCSYEARAYGVHSAMPTGRARRLCPNAVFLAGRYELYNDYSRRIHQILSSFTPLVEGIGLDEAFLDVTGGRRLFGRGPQVAAAIQRRIYAELGLRASVGVGSNKLVAKLASKAAKPGVSGVTSGIKVVPPGTELDFLHPLPVGSLWGVGPATLRRLDRFGVRTVRDLAQLPVATLTGSLGPAAGRHLHDLSWGRDDSPVVPARQPKSIGHEETYATDYHDRPPLLRELVRLADAVGDRARSQNLAGRTVTIKVRFGDFRTITRSRSLPRATDSGAVMARVAGELLEAVDVSVGVRLLGLSLSNLLEVETSQLGLDEAGGQTSLDEAMDQVRAKFGREAVGPAVLLGPNGLGPKRRGHQQWGPDERPR